MSEIDNATVPIRSAEIQSGIAPQWQPFFRVDSSDLPRDFLPVIEAFWVAVAMIAPLARLTEPVKILIATTPFRATMKPGLLVMQLKDDAFHAYVENIIFFDVVRARNYARPVQIASFLEELVHVVMRVADEELVARIVATIYPGITYTDGEYRIAAP